MKKIDKEFNIPYYIFEEIIEYIELTAKGHCKSAKWNNIKALLNCAMINDRFTQEQVNFLIAEFNREKL